MSTIVFIDSGGGGGGGTDPDFASVVLLCHMNGTNGGSSFPDSSSYAHTMTRSGAVTSTAASKFGGASLDATTGGIQTATAAELRMGTGAFTAEAWVNLNTNSGGAFTTNPIICGQENNTATAGRWFFGLTRIFDTTPGCLTLYFDGNPIITGTTQLSTGTWHHVAVCKDGVGGTTRIFLDGVSEGSVSDSNDYLAAIPLKLFDQNTFDGYGDDARVTKGVARYTTGFTPPAAQFPDAGGLDPTDYRFANISAAEMSLESVGRVANRTTTGSSAFKNAWSESVLTGKTYWEMEVISRSSASYSIGVGLSTDSDTSFNNSPWYGVVLGGGCGVSGGYWSGGSFAAGGGYAFALGDRIGFAYDAATRKLWISVNGVYVSGDPVAGTGETATLASNSYVASASFYDCTGGSGTMKAQIVVQVSEFETAPPSGFSAYAS